MALRVNYFQAVIYGDPVCSSTFLLQILYSVFKQRFEYSKFESYSVQKNFESKSEYSREKILIRCVATFAADPMLVLL